MRLRKLGDTGEHVSELGLGTAFMAREQDQTGVNDCIARAVERGISYFDTAAGYGNAEEMLGGALNGRRDGVFLATKVGGVAGDGHRQVDALMQQFERGLTRLQTDRVDLIQLHEADERKWWSDDPVSDEVAKSRRAPLIRDEEDYDFAGSPCVEFLRRARNQGKARFIGITGKDARRLARIVNEVQLDAMMIAHQYNPILRNAARFLLEATSQKGVGVACGAMLLKGWLARPQSGWRHDRPAWMDDDFHRAYFAYLDIQAASGYPASGAHLAMGASRTAHSQHGRGVSDAGRDRGEHRSGGTRTTAGRSAGGDRRDRDRSAAEISGPERAVKVIGIAPRTRRRECGDSRAKRQRAKKPRPTGASGTRSSSTFRGVPATADTVITS